MIWDSWFFNTGKRNRCSKDIFSSEKLNSLHNRASDFSNRCKFHYDPSINLYVTFAKYKSLISINLNETMKQVYCNIQIHLLYTIYSINIFETIIASLLHDGKVLRQKGMYRSLYKTFRKFLHTNITTLHYASVTRKNMNFNLILKIT